MASNIAQQRIQREFREVVKSEEVAKSGVQVQIQIISYTILTSCEKIISLQMSVFTQVSMFFIIAFFSGRRFN